jgi:cytochrome P450
VHSSAQIFRQPDEFIPQRWLPESNSDVDVKLLESNLVAFSRGPRSCLGINLAWCELYVAFATMLRRFDDLEIDKTNPPADLRFRDTFLPHFFGSHLMVRCKPATE